MEKLRDIQFHPRITSHIFSGVNYNVFKYTLHHINIFPNFIALYIYKNCIMLIYKYTMHNKLSIFLCFASSCAYLCAMSNNFKGNDEKRFLGK